MLAQLGLVLVLVIFMMLPWILAWVALANPPLAMRDFEKCHLSLGPSQFQLLFFGLFSRFLTDRDRESFVLDARAGCEVGLVVMSAGPTRSPEGCAMSNDLGLLYCL